MLVGYFCVPALTCLQIIKNTADCQYVVEQEKWGSTLSFPRLGIDETRPFGLYKKFVN